RDPGGRLVSSAAKPAQSDQMRGAPGRLAKISRERANVRAAVAANLDIEIGPHTSQDFPLVNGHCHGLELHRLPAPGSGVRTHAGNAFRREDRRPLEQMSGERPDRALHDVLWWWRGLEDHLALGIVRRGSRTEANRGAIHLGLVVEKGNETG